MKLDDLDNLDNRLKRMNRHIGGESSGKSAKPTSARTKVPPRYLRLAEALDAELVHDPAGSYCVVTRTYPFDFSFGDVRLPELEPGTQWPVASFETRNAAGVLSPFTAVFFDTETTGLGGVGAVPFLVGCGSLTPDGLEVRQYLLPDYTDEAAMLERVMTEFSDDRCLVSYNGRAFDIPLVRDRLIVNRVARQIPYAHHVDLLHSSRRLFRRRLGDCSLTNVEREIFGFYREDDLPGYLVPAAYFDWLSSEEVGQLPDVLEHNRWDIVTLYFLMARVASIFQTKGGDLDHVDDLYSLSRVFDRRKERHRVVDIYRRIDESGERPGEELVWFHSLAFKREGRWEEAVKLWQQLGASPTKEGFLASIELAKYYEHRVKDAALAYEIVQQAAENCPPTAASREGLLNRLRRLRRKLTK
ncbi:hypothetical protein GF377_08230 [candidate division GN15 bacterium]|nr:hypothetical protein [candidate division GN15 bacterium]